jgi:predicted DCC family thiol-disulfide oxidoreductase YuxK
VSNATVTVWFDSACPLCRREIRLMRALDWRNAISFVDIHAQDTHCPIDPALLLARFHAQDQAGNLVSGAAAFALMWRQIPLLWPLGQVARVPAILRLLERAYLRFLAWRQRRHS